MKRDQSSKRVTRSMSKQIKDDSTGAVVDPRNAMFAAIKSRGGSKGNNDSPKPAGSGDARQSLLGAITNKKKGAMSDTDGDSSPSYDVKHSPGVHRLQEFLTHSETILSLAEQDQDAAIRACKVCHAFAFFIIVMICIIASVMKSHSSFYTWAMISQDLAVNCEEEGREFSA